MTLTLRDFTPADDAALISWLRTPDELFYFSGPLLSFPLDSAQLDMIRAMPDGRAWSALDGDGQLVGHIELVQTGPDSARVVRVLLSPDHRGRGLGPELVLAVIAQARADGLASLTLKVVETNAGAIRIYEKLGFEHTGPSEDREDIIAMRKVL